MKKIFDFKTQTMHWLDERGAVARSQKVRSAKELIESVQKGAISSVAGLADLAAAKLVGSARPHDGFRIFSRWSLEHWRDGRLIHREAAIPNLYTTEGITYILNTIFKNQTRLDPWYVGIQSTNNPASGWTMANQGSTWSQFTNVDETSWPEAVDGSISGGQITMTQVTFNIAGSGTIYGAHLTSNSTKGATSGTLLCAVNFTASRSVVSGDDLLVTYTVGAQDDGV